MYIHKEGFKSIVLSLLIFVVLFFALFLGVEKWNFCHYFTVSLLGIIVLFITSFFRIPKRNFVYGKNKIITPADGKVVVVEEVFEPEFLKEKCLQISVFMSPANVHVNRYSIAGTVVYQKYHKGKYLVASHPKSSTENERTSIGLQTENGTKILFRQVAGALARRIVCYAKEGGKVQQNAEMGFIKFGSRVDIFLPLSAKIHAKLDDKVKNGLSCLAEIE